MEQIFEMLIQTVMAYFQIVMMFFGAIFCAFGISIFVSKLQRPKTREHWVNATVTAIREGEGMADENGVKGKVYYPVFEAVGPNGEMVTYEYKSRGYGIDKFKIGDRYKVLPLEKEPGFVALEGDAKSDTFIMVFMLSMGGMMIALPTIFIPITSASFFVWGVTAAFMAFKFKKLIKPKHLRETIAVFKARRAKEAIESHQHKREISQTEIVQTTRKFERIGAIACKFAIIIGFLILCVGGLGYNSQQHFIENAVLEIAGPCGGDLNTDCRRTIILEDIMSVLPLNLRPEMNGTYHANFDANKMMVDYGPLTHLPYFILMALGALIILSNIRRLSTLNQTSA